MNWSGVVKVRFAILLVAHLDQVLVKRLELTRNKLNNPSRESDTVILHLDAVQTMESRASRQRRYTRGHSLFVGCADGLEHELSPSLLSRNLILHDPSPYGN